MNFSETIDCLDINSPGAPKNPPPKAGAGAVGAPNKPPVEGAETMTHVRNQASNTNFHQIQNILPGAGAPNKEVVAGATK
jgi:hypothetical protein